MVTSFVHDNIKITSDVGRYRSKWTSVSSDWSWNQALRHSLSLGWLVKQLNEHRLWAHCGLRHMQHRQVQSHSLISKKLMHVWNLYGACSNMENPSWLNWGNISLQKKVNIQVSSNQDTKMSSYWWLVSRTQWPPIKCHLISQDSPVLCLVMSGFESVNVFFFFYNISFLFIPHFPSHISVRLKRQGNWHKWVLDACKWQ